MYPAQLTIPMSKDLTDYGFSPLSTASDVEQVLDNQEGTTLLVVNSVCGCAAANARSDKVPTRLATVFAGVDPEAVSKAREYLLPYPPSSPAIALFKDGKLVHLLERRHIEGRTADMIADNLRMAFETHC
jgi:putative YphP/YqiW family bacilliredoxin